MKTDKPAHPYSLISLRCALFDSFLTQIAKTEHNDPNLAWARKPFCVFSRAQALTRLLERGEEAKEK